MARIKYFNAAENRWVYADAPTVNIEASVVDIYGLGEITEPTDGDDFLVYNVTNDTNAKISWQTIKNKLKSYFDGLYAFKSHTHTKSQITDFPDVPTTREFEALEEDVQDNTAAINALDTRMDVAESDIDTLGSGLSEAETNITNLGERIDDVEQSISSAGGGVGRNFIDNGGFIVNQRGNNSYTGQVYGFDRWRGARTTSSISKPDGQNYAAISGGNVNQPFLEQRMEVIDVKNLRGRTVTLGAYTKTACAIHIVEKSDSTYGTSISTVKILTCAPNTVNKTTFTFSPNSDYIVVEIRGVGSTTTVQVICVTLEVGNHCSAGEFVPEYSKEWLRCCRFYYKTVLDEIVAAFTASPGSSPTTGNGAATIVAPVPMRIRPTAHADVTSSIWGSYSPSYFSSISTVTRGFDSKSNFFPVNIAYTSNGTAESFIGIASLKSLVLDADL